MRVKPHLRHHQNHQQYHKSLDKCLSGLVSKCTSPSCRWKREAHDLDHQSQERGSLLYLLGEEREGDASHSKERAQRRQKNLSMWRMAFRTGNRLKPHCTDADALGETGIRTSNVRFAGEWCRAGFLRNTLLLAVVMCETHIVGLGQVSPYRGDCGNREWDTGVMTL